MLWGLFALLVLVVVLKRRRQRRVRLLYRYGQLVNEEVVFPCGCRFHWTDLDQRVICEAHKAIIDAEVTA